MIIGLLGFFGFIVFGIIWIISLIRKNGKAKRNFIISVACFALFVIGLVTDTSDVDNKAKEDEVVEADATKDEIEEDTKENQSNQDEDEKKVKEENENKAAKEKEDKEKEEQQKKKEEEAKKNEVVYTYEDLVIGLTEGKVEIPEESSKLIRDNLKLFPADNNDDISKVKDKTKDEIGSKHLNKNVSPYHSDIVSIAGNVIKIEEGDYDDNVLSYVHMMDDDFNSFEIILLKETDEIFEDDQIRFWGIPVGANDFDNISGGTTLSQVIVGSHIEKQ